MKVVKEFACQRRVGKFEKTTGQLSLFQWPLDKAPAISYFIAFLLLEL